MMNHREPGEFGEGATIISEPIRNDDDAYGPLIKRLEKAKAGSRELDALIHALADGRTVCEVIHPQFGRQLLARNSRPPHDEYWLDHPAHALPAYTTSLDAIVSLIEKRLPGAIWTKGVDGEVQIWRDPTSSYFEPPAEAEKAATTPLALCISFLKALQSGRAS